MLLAACALELVRLFSQRTSNWSYRARPNHKGLLKAESSRESALIYMQVPRVVVEGVSNHMLHNNAQLMAGYSVSNRATKTIDAAHSTMKVR